MALIDKASLLMVPSTYEAGTLYNVLPSGNRAPDSTGENSGYDQTRADFTFDRGSNAAATRIGSDGLIKKYRENEALQSNSFNVSPWSLGNSVLTANASTSPTGESNAAKIESNGINKETRTRQTISGATTGKVYTFSCYMKAGNVSYAIVRHYGISSNGRAWFNLSNGTIGTKDASLIDAKIESVGDGWYRCSITGKITTSGALDLAPAPNDNDYLSDAAGEYVFLYGAQAESGLVATDYLDSGATTGKAGVLIDLPRINYDANGENGSLLLEPSRQNKIQYSEYFGASYWAKSGSSVVSGFTSPEGLSNAYKLIEDTSSVTHSFVFPAINTSSNNTYSIYIKANGRTKIGFREVQETGYYAAFNLSSNVVIEKSSQVTASIVPLNDGWKRCEINFPVTTSTVMGFYMLSDSYTTGDPLTTTYTGDGTSGVYLYGAQLEANATYATSYIPNMGESGGVTRAADSCSGAGDSSTFNDSEGVFFAEFSAFDIATNSKAISIYKTSSPTSNAVILYYNGNRIAFDILNPSGTVSVTTNISNAKELNKAAIKYKSGDIALWFNGVEIVTRTNTLSLSGLDKLEFEFGFNNDFYGNTKQILYFPTALSDSELATLTTL